MRLYEQSLALLENRKIELDPDDYRIVFMGDSWVEKLKSAHYEYTSNDIFQVAMEEAKKQNPLLIYYGGDSVFTGTRELLENFIITKNKYAPSIPMFTAIGNHELEPVENGPWSPENYKDIIGPVHYALNIPEYRFSLIVLDTMYHYVYKEYGLTDEEILFLKSSLRGRQKNTFVATHVPPRTWKWNGDGEAFTINRDRFLEEIEGKVSKAFVSHIHAYDTEKIKNTEFILSGGGGAPLNVYEVFHIVCVHIKRQKGKSTVTFEQIPVGWV
ncbi:MAG TPA: metallophosphoesterase [Clostridia bacterium]